MNKNMNFVGDWKWFTNRIDSDVRPEQGEVEIGNDWYIAIKDNAGPLIRNIAKDLQDYLFVSMHVSVLIHRVANIDEMADVGEQVIVLALQEELPALKSKLDKSRSYRIITNANRIIVCGYDDRGVGQGSYYLEDLMNLREAPFVSDQDISRAPLFSPRMAHSGWGLDRYPDAHLNAMAHAGIDAILLFVQDVDQTPEGYQDFNYIVDRAAAFGLDVYTYSYMTNRKHPDDDHFKPNGKVTRAQFAAMVSRALNLKTTAAHIPFTDVPSDSWYADVVSNVYSAKIIRGRTVSSFTLICSPYGRQVK